MKDKVGATPLHLACQFGRVQAAATLLAAGAKSEVQVRAGGYCSTVGHLGGSFFFHFWELFILLPPGNEMRAASNILIPFSPLASKYP